MNSVSYIDELSDRIVDEFNDIMVREFDDQLDRLNRTIHDRMMNELNHYSNDDKQYNEVSSRDQSFNMTEFKDCMNVPHDLLIDEADTLLVNYLRFCRISYECIEPQVINYDPIENEVRQSLLKNEEFSADQYQDLAKRALDTGDLEVARIIAELMNVGGWLPVFTEINSSLACHTLLGIHELRQLCNLDEVFLCLVNSDKEIQYCTNSRYTELWKRINVYRISNRKAIVHVVNRPTIDTMILNLKYNDDRAWCRYRLIEWLIDISPEQFNESKHLPKLIDAIRSKYESQVLSLIIALYDRQLIDLSSYLGVHECIDNIVQYRRRLLTTKRTRASMKK